MNNRVPHLPERRAHAKLREMRCPLTPSSVSHRLPPQHPTATAQQNPSSSRSRECRHGREGKVVASDFARSSAPRSTPTARDRASPGAEVARTLCSMPEPVKQCIVLQVTGGSHAVRQHKDLHGGGRVLVERNRFYLLADLAEEEEEALLAPDAHLIADPVPVDDVADPAVAGDVGGAATAAAEEARLMRLPPEA
ncbi:hypothetical protein ACP4OV_000765 [Aristida adscensionis]